MNLLDFKSITLIHKGWSNDRKYCATDMLGKQYLLRVSLIDNYDKKKIEFDMMQRVSKLDVPMCEPIEFGTFSEGVYSLHSWINGVDAEEIIATLSKEEQYSYGFEAGQILKRIHSIPAPSEQESWEERFNKKIDSKIKNYNECSTKYENMNVFIDYINANRHLLKGRPQSYQHGDYHIGNMMITNDQDKKLKIIDFDRNDYGDPWEEFNRIAWCTQKSPVFASAMINGYFDNNIPDDFWKLLALYVSVNTLSSIPWSISFGQAEVDTMLAQAKEILSWYDNMKATIPTWYNNSYTAN